VPDYIQVSFYILDDNVYRQIIESVNKIDGGIVSVIHPNVTNTIEVSAKWNESEFDNKIKEIQKIDNVKSIKIYKKNKLAVRNIIESITLSESVSWNLEKEPVGEVTRARDTKDYYKGISLSCTLFQNYGKEILLSHYKKTGVNIAKKQLSHLESIIRELYTQNIIDKTIYDKLNNVRNLRNELQHEDRAIKYSSDQADEAENIIDQAIECLKLLKSKYDTR
jgi:hypothetical protein